MKSKLNVNRRNFLKTAGAAAVIGTAGLLEVPREAWAGEGKLATLFDLTKCDGCRDLEIPACVAACKKIKAGRIPEPTDPIPSPFPTRKIVSLQIHYIASVAFIAAAFFHLFYHGLLNDRGLLPQKGDVKTSIMVVKTFFGKGEEPPFEKYLPEQRLAYLGMALIIAVLIGSGLIKTYKNVFAPDLSHTLILLATWLHNIFFVLFILAFAGHIGAIVLKPNRPLARGIFTGKVRLDYARHRHPLWMQKLEPAVLAPQMAADQEISKEACTIEIQPLNATVDQERKTSDEKNLTTDPAEPAGREEEK